MQWICGKQPLKSFAWEIQQNLQTKVRRPLWMKLRDLWCRQYFQLKFRPNITVDRLIPNLFQKMIDLAIGVELVLITKLNLVNTLECIGCEVLHHAWYNLRKLPPGFLRTLS